MKDTNQYYDQVKLLTEALPITMEDPDLALKGGTAINLFIKNMPRLSVDIDLTFLPVLDRETSLSLINSKMSAIANKLQSSISEVNVRIVYTNDRICRNIELVKGYTRIKIDINHILRGHVNPCSILPLCENARRDFEAFTNVKCLSFNDIYAGKLCAALSRQHPRDLFDVKILLDDEGISDGLRKTFIVYLISSNCPIADMINPSFKDVREVFHSEFLGMNFLHVEYEELEDARKRLRDILQATFTEEEKAFLISFKAGDPEWDRLGLPNIAELPAIKWKLSNIQKMKQSQHKIAFTKLQESLCV